MAVARGLRRLLRIRNLEEEQNRLALESAIGELHRMEIALAAAQTRERSGRRLVAASALTGEVCDRQAGLVESDAARRNASMIATRITTAQMETARLRQRFLDKRVERRQAETLIEEAGARDAMEAGHTAQRSVDDWYRSRLYRDAEKPDVKSGAAANSTGGSPTLDQIHKK